MTDRKTGVSFVLPMYNEEENILRTIQTLREVGERITDDFEIVLVDDASVDGCAEIAEKEAAADSRLRLYRLDSNSKFGGAFAKGFKMAGKDVIIYMDSDLPVKTEDIMASVPYIDMADIVTGYSTVKKGDTVKRKIISGVYNAMVRGLFGLDVRDINSGYKVVRRRLVEDMDFMSRSPFVDVELFLHAKGKGADIYQYPLVFTSRTGGRSYIARIPVIMATFRDMIKVWFIKVLRRRAR